MIILLSVTLVMDCAIIVLLIHTTSVFIIIISFFIVGILGAICVFKNVGYCSNGHLRWWKGKEGILFFLHFCLETLCKCRNTVKAVCNVLVLMHFKVHLADIQLFFNTRVTVHSLSALSFNVVHSLFCCVDIRACLV